MGHGEEIAEALCWLRVLTAAHHTVILLGNASGMRRGHSEAIKKVSLIWQAPSGVIY